MKMKSILSGTLTVIFLAGSGIGQERFRREAPPPDPLPALTLPQISRHTLTNDLNLMVVRIEKAPIMHLRLIIGDGEGSSPESLPGLATFTANMLNKGAANLTSSQIEEQIESIGGSYSVDVFPDYSRFSLSFLEEFMDEALNLLSKMVLTPTFTKGEIDNVKRSMYYDHLQKYNNPESLGIKLLYQILLQNHPYRNITFTEDVIKNFNREDLLVFFDKYFRPNNAKILVFGDVNLDIASRKISHYFKDWTSREIEKDSPLPPVPNEAVKICFIDMPQSKDVTLFLGKTFPLDDQNNLISYCVFNQALGGTANSRLLLNLRESKSYAYWVFSEVRFFGNFGIFLVRSLIKPDAIYRSVSEIINEIRKAKLNPLPISEIEQAKSYLISHFPLTIQSVGEFASKVSEIEAYSRGESLWDKYYENVMMVNAGDVFESISNTDFLMPVVVIVGDEDRLIDQLNEFDEVVFYDKNGKQKFSLKKGEIG